MYNLNVINLIQAGTVTACLLGCMILWRYRSLRGVTLLLGLIAVASIVNIAEEVGLTRDIYLISPVFIILFGPATYLACIHLTTGRLANWQWLHLVPAAIALAFTQYVQTIIAVGTVWRIGYALLTAQLLLKQQSRLEQQRSDSDEFSLKWLVYIVVITAAFNLVDLVRLNTQHLIGLKFNLMGQGLNNLVWLAAVMAIVVNLVNQGARPNPGLPSDDAVDDHDSETADGYASIFGELDQALVKDSWYLRPRLSLDDVSQLSGLQPRDISRAINLVKQQSFNEYINRYRVQFICLQIDQAPLQSLTKLWGDAGFSSKGAFNKAFKQITGVTPSQYRAK